jgi:PAS domain S-box-containing protein
MDLSDLSAPNINFDLSHCNLSFYDNGIIIFTFKPGAKYKLADAIEVSELLKKNFSGQKFLIVVDINNLKEASQEVRKFHGKPEEQQFIGASAIVTAQPITRLLASLYLKLNKPKIPIRLFSDREKALDWLETIFSQNTPVVVNPSRLKVLTEVKSVETASSQIFLRADGILEYRAKKVNQSIIEAKENTRVLKEIVGAQAYPFLLNMRTVGNVDRLAREHYSSVGSLAFASKIAIVVGNIFTRMIGNTALSLFRAKTQVPMQLFHSEVEATNWLLSVNGQVTTCPKPRIRFFSKKEDHHISNYKSVKFSGAQIEELFLTLSRFAIGDFSHRMNLSSSHEVFNTLELAVNMLGEELEHSTLSKGTFSQIVNSAPAIFYTSRINKFYDFNFVGRNIETLGFNADKLVEDANVWLNAIHDEDRADLKWQIAESKVKAACEFKYRIKNKAGSQFWIKDKRKVIYDEAGRATEVVGFWLDVSEEERLKDQSQSLFSIIGKTAINLHEENPAVIKKGDAENFNVEPNFIDSILSLSKLHNYVDSLKIQAAVFANTSESIMITDKDVNIQAVNPGFEKISGYSRTEVLGRNPKLLSSGQHYPEYYRELWATLINTGHWQGEIVNKRKNGELYVQFTSISTIKNDQGEVVQYLSVANEVTARVKAEEELRKLNMSLAAATQAKTNFISNMSHEIRTPLNSIIGLSDLLNTPDMPLEQQEYLGRIIKSGQNLLELINNILDLSKIESGAIELEYRDFDLDSVIKEVFGLLELRAVQKGINFSLVFNANETHLLKGDPLRIRQVLINLIGNSIKFTDKGFCKIEIGPHVLRGDHLQIRVAVIDSGIGIAEDKLSQLFGRFSQMDTSITRQYGGSGLGLSISRELVYMMKGDIRVRSQIGVGSEFEITIPLEVVRQRANIDSIKTEVSDLPTRELRILVVDDNEDNRLLIKAYLKKLPYHLSFAANGEEAIAQFQANNYDLILMDMQMPIMDGYTATEIIRKFETDSQKKHLPIVALTGFALNIEKEKALAAGCDLHMAKPIKKQELLNTIMKLTDLNDSKPKGQTA